MMTVDEVGKLYELKPESLKEPDIYLSANMEREGPIAEWHGVVGNG